MPITERRSFLRQAGTALVAPAFLRAAGRRPNILFAIYDDQSWVDTSAAGSGFVRTPAFDRVAGEGIQFTRGFCSVPACAPSRASILTGRNFWELEDAACHFSNFPAKFEVYPDMVERAGYFVGYTGKGWGPGEWADSGRTRNPAGPGFSKITTDPPRQGISRKDYAANFAAFLEARPKDRPFCFWYGAHEPHRSHHRGAGVKAGKKLEDVAVPSFLPDAAEVRGELLDYALEIEWADMHLGRMLKRLEEAAELDNTLVVVTADNGMPFPRCKSNLYDYGVRLPLAMCWPAGFEGGRQSEAFVSFTDFAPTFLEAAALPVPGEMRGRSLLPLLRGETATHRSCVYLGRERHAWSQKNGEIYPMRAVRDSNYLYIRNYKPHLLPAGSDRPEYNSGLMPYNDGEGGLTKALILEQGGKLFELCYGRRPAEELYDVRRDPEQIRNLAESADHAAVKKRLRGNLDDYLKETGDPRALGRGDVFDNYIYYGSHGAETEGLPLKDYLKKRGKLAK